MKVIENKQLGDYRKLTFEGTKDYYLLNELDERRRIFQVIKIEHKGNRVRVINSKLGIHKEDLGEDEKNIFEDGRTKSKYLNALAVFNYYGIKYLNCSYEEFKDTDKSDVDFYEHLHDLTNVSTKELSNGNYAIYFDKLREDYQCGTTVLSDQVYENGSKTQMTSSKSMRFYLNVMRLVGLKDVVGASWRHDDVSGLNILKLKCSNGVTIILTGFEFGKGKTSKSTGGYNVLKNSGFTDKECDQLYLNIQGKLLRLN